MTLKKKSFQVTIIVLLLSIVAFGIIITSYSQDSRKPQDAKQDANKNIPIVDFDEINTDDATMKQIRQKRGNRYKPSKLFLRAEEEGIEPLPTITHWDNNLPALPVTKSDLIVIGYVANTEAHLTDDHRGLYTEVSIQIKDILKSADKFTFAPNL